MAGARSRPEPKSKGDAGDGGRGKSNNRSRVFGYGTTQRDVFSKRLWMARNVRARKANVAVIGPEEMLPFCSKWRTPFG
jgi:hypothetical protein